MRPRPPGVVDGSVPPGARVWWVLTAHDPGPVRLDPVENARRTAVLRAALDAVPGLPRHACVASAPDGAHAEEGVLVGGLAEPAVLDLARRFGQDAVFSWTASAWSVVACRGGARLDLGWELTRRVP